jgi:hypothetical protein
MITTARCGGRWANAGLERRAALEARNSRRERKEAICVPYSIEEFLEQVKKR